MSSASRSSLRLRLVGLAICIAPVSLCIRPDLIWYFTYLFNYWQCIPSHPGSQHTYKSCRTYTHRSLGLNSHWRNSHVFRATVIAKLNWYLLSAGLVRPLLCSGPNQTQFISTKVHETRLLLHQWPRHIVHRWRSRTRSLHLYTSKPSACTTTIPVP